MFVQIVCWRNETDGMEWNGMVESGGKETRK